MGFDFDLLVPIGFFAMVAAIVILPRYFRSQERQKLADTIRVAIEKGQPLPPEVMHTLTNGEPSRPPPPPRSDLRRGVVWLAVAVGIALFGLALGYAEPDATMPFLAFAAIPGCIGAAFIVLGLIEKPKA